MSIVEALEKHRIQSIERSERYSELRERETRSKGAAVRSLISKDDTTYCEGIPIEAAELRKLYYDMLHTYKGGSFSFPKTIGNRGKALWLRVLKAKKQSEVNSEEFMRAQFHWFHKTFGTSPTVAQLTTEGAVSRAREFCGTKTTGNIVGNNTPLKKDRAEIFRHSERMVQDIMRAQKCSSRQDFYRRFILTGMFVLPSEFLAADPVYKEVLDE